MRLYFLYLTTFSTTRNAGRRLADVLLENEGTKIRKTRVMAEFALLSQYLSRGTVVNHVKLQLVSASKIKPETSQ